MSRCRFIFIMVGGALVAVLAAGCTGSATPSPSVLAGTGAVVSETRDVATFTRLEARHGVQLELSIGSPASLVVTAQANLLPIITTSVADGRLVVDAKQDFQTSSGVIVRVTVPELMELAVAGGASARASKIDAESLSVRTDGAGPLAIEGRADALALVGRGGGKLELAGLAARTAKVDLVGGIAATITATESATGSATGGVVLTVKGSPATLDVSTSAGAVVLKG